MYLSLLNFYFFTTSTILLDDDFLKESNPIDSVNYINIYSDMFKSAYISHVLD